MLSIETALDLYIDKLNTNEQIDLEWFEGELSNVDYAEFIELIPFVRINMNLRMEHEPENNG
jgi:hypothetical protein